MCDGVSVFGWMSETTSDCITGSAAMLTDHNNSNNNHICDFTHKNHQIETAPKNETKKK